MSSLEAAQLVTLLLVGQVAGNDLGTAAVINPALNAIPEDAQFAVDKTIIRRFGYVMPWLLPLTLAAGIVMLVLIDDRSSTSFALAVAGVAALGGWELLAFALFPINKQIWEAQAPLPVQEWRQLRRRWDRFHVVRTALSVAAFAMFVLSVVLE